MITHYVDIDVWPDAETPANQLMSALFAKLHRVLVRLQLKTVGASFPGYSEKPRSLGRTLRLLGTHADLDRLLAESWLMGVADHVKVKPIHAVPASAVQRTLRRVQVKSDVERLVRRRARRKGMSLEQARRDYEAFQEVSLGLPSILVQSASTGMSFDLELRLGPPQQVAQTGEFNAYGLSPTATIPWF